MEREKIIQTACRDLGKVSLTLKSNFEEMDKSDIDFLDIAIKDLINVRSVIDFSSNKQLTQNNWNQIKEDIQ